uniref:Uncharacterized protein n=1 Tax=Strigamia maritima TaxID=126957 RepID=T1JI74_STRMM
MSVAPSKQNTPSDIDTIRRKKNEAISDPSPVSTVNKQTTQPMAQPSYMLCHDRKWSCLISTPCNSVICHWLVSMPIIHAPQHPKPNWGFLENLNGTLSTGRLMLIGKSRVFCKAIVFASDKLEKLAE